MAFGHEPWLMKADGTGRDGYAPPSTACCPVWTTYGTSSVSPASVGGTRKSESCHSAETSRQA